MKKFVIVIFALAFSLGLFACSNPNQSSVKEEPETNKTLMIGDSLFDLWKSTCANDLNGLENLTNIAIGGTNSMSWGKSLKLIQRELPVSNIIISLGTNDIADLHRTAQQTANGDSMGMGLKDLLNALHELAPNAQIYLLTINICGEQNRWNARGEIRACNQIMREYCATLDWATMVETENAFYNDTNYEEKPASEYFVPDYLHFSAKGYQVLTAIVRQALGLE